MTTQIDFEGDEYNEWDPWWAASLTIRLDPYVDNDLMPDWLLHSAVADESECDNASGCDQHTSHAPHERQREAGRRWETDGAEEQRIDAF